MRWFHKQKNSNVTKATLDDKAASKIAGWMLVLQNKFASSMNKNFSKLSMIRRKIAVVFFCLIGGGLSMYYITEALMGTRKANPLEQVGKFEIPRQSNENEMELIPNLFIDEETWSRLQSFKKYMDSLKAKDDPEYYKIMNARPGLMDSIYQLEQIYYSQKSK